MNEIGIKDQRFSVGISFSGIPREKAAKALGRLFGAEPEAPPEPSGVWKLQDRDGKTWKLSYDPLVHGEWKVYKEALPRWDRSWRVRLESPPLDYGELPKLEECLQTLQRAGGRVNDSCEMSVHVDAGNHNRQSLKNLIGIMYSKEDIMFRALQVNEARAAVYSKKVREPLVEQMRALSCDETRDLTELEQIWYEGNVRPDQPLNKTCRYALNLHSVFFRNTVEWRCFNATLNPDRAAAYVNLCLAMSAQAIAQRSAVIKKTVSENEQFTFRTWLVRLGLNGAEFKRTREILLENLSGDKAWLRPKTPESAKKAPKRRRGEAVK